MRLKKNSMMLITLLINWDGFAWSGFVAIARWMWSLVARWLRLGGWGNEVWNGMEFYIDYTGVNQSYSYFTWKWLAYFLLKPWPVYAFTPSKFFFKIQWGSEFRQFENRNNLVFLARKIFNAKTRWQHKSLVMVSDQCH